MHQAWLWDIRLGVGFGKAAFWEERVDRDVVRVIFFIFSPAFHFYPQNHPDSLCGFSWRIISQLSISATILRLFKNHFPPTYRCNSSILSLWKRPFPFVVTLFSASY